MSKTKKRISPLGEMVELLARIVGFVTLVGTYIFFENVDYVVRIVLSFVMCVLSMLFVLAIYRLSSRSKPAVEATFEFDTTKRSNRETASEFEYEVAGLINQLTGKRTQVVGGAGDEGIDIKVLDDDDRLVGIVQCKKLSPKKAVYPAYIRDLNTVRHYHHINTAYLVSTGYFTEKSQELARNLGVKLIDGKALKQIRKRAMKTS